MKSEHQERIEKFMEGAGQHLPASPVIPDRETRLLRARLILEEAMETISGLGFYAVCNTIDALPICFGHRPSRHLHKVLDVSTIYFEDKVPPDLVEIADGCADLSVVTIGTLSACGIHDQELLAEVDSNNLSKLRPPICPRCLSAMCQSETHWICSQCTSTLPLDHGPRMVNGKLTKGRNWCPPDIGGVLARQGDNTSREKK